MIIGGSGRVGSQVTRWLVERGRPVRVLVRPSSSIRRLAPVLSKVRLVAGDVRDEDSLTEAVRGVQSVIWTAGIFHENRKAGETYESVEVEGVKNLIRACIRESVSFIGYLSMVHVAPDSRSRLFRAKYQAEEEIRQSGLHYTILRSSPLIHTEPVSRPDQLPLNWLKRFSRVPLWLPSVRYHPISDRDAAQYLIETPLNPRVRNQTVSIGGPEAFTPEELLRLAAEMLNRPIRPVRFSRWLADAALWIGSRIAPRNVLSPVLYRDWFRENIAMDPARLSELFPHVTPMSIRDILEEQVKQLEKTG